MAQSSDFTHTRTSGVLLHISSLPSAYGIGDLGRHAHTFVDQLADAGQSWWQILPLNPPAAGGSPYSSHSALAGNPLLIDLDELYRLKLLTRADLAAARMPPGPVNFAALERTRPAMLAAAAERFFARPPRHLKRAFDRFCAANAAWLDDYALYMAIRHSAGKPWQKWPRPLAMHEAHAVVAARRNLAPDINRLRFEQFIFDRQLRALRAHAASRNVRIIGDMPIFVAADSVDVWAHRDLFQLNATGRPRVVAGVPPDLFSATGQLWGNPLYDWRRMRVTGFQWWVERIRAALNQVDVIRIDHFRGLSAFWEIPGRAKTAERGRWVEAPGDELLVTLQEQLGSLPLLAEDLGLITPDVDRLRDDFDLPGMRVIQFAFGGDPADTHLTHNHVRNSVVYTGTHDNDTSRSWYQKAGRATRRRAAAYIPDIAKDPAWALMRYAMSSVAAICIIPAQDILSLGNEARMNVPGVAHGNWTWRLHPRQWTPPLTRRLRQLTELYNRA